jgi:hypothetical protein
MNTATRRRLGFLAALVLLGALPFVGRALGTPPGSRCARDGVALAGSPVVTFVERDGSEISFCCVSCAEAWHPVGPGGAVRVTDEASGRVIDARNAWFVRSLVVAQPATRDRVHAFATRAEAERHARAYRGRILSGKQRPFGGED